MKEEKVWKILEIEPTSDEEAIRTAYRAKLVNTNPEDDQEGFMKLKEAYDTALELAKKEGGEEEPEYSEVISRVDAIYKDIEKRMDPACWKELFSDPVFTNLDEQDEVRREFLEYTMGHYKYPGEVLSVIDNVFTILHDKADLIEEFPENFINFLCDNIINEGDYGLSEMPIIGRANGIQSINDVVVEYNGEPTEEPEFDYEIDEYISTINSFISNYRRAENPDYPEDAKAAEIESLGESILQAREYDFFHPFEEIAVIRYLYYKENYDECFRILKERVEATVMAGEKHSDFYYSHLIYMYLRFFVLDRHKDMGLEISDEELDMCFAVLSKTMHVVYVNETHAALGLYWYLKGDKRRANEYLFYVSEQIKSTGWTEISDQIDKERMEELPARIEAEADNLSMKISLGWLYARAERVEDAFAVLDSIPEEDHGDMEYQAIMGRLLINDNKFDEALPYLKKWNELLVRDYGYEKNLDTNQLPIEDVRQVVRVPYSYYLIAAALTNMGEFEEAKEYVKKSLEGAPLKEYYEFTDLYNYLFNVTGSYEEGLEFWNKELEKNNEYVTICHGGRQYMAYKAGDVNAVVDDYFYLRNYDPMYVDSYVFAEEIFLDYDDLESFEAALQYIEKAGVEDVRLDINKAKYLFDKEENDAAEELFKETIEKYPDEAEAYYEYGRFLNRTDRKDEAGKQFELGLEKNPDHEEMLYSISEYYNDYRFEVLEEVEYNQKAIDCSEKLLGIKYDARTAVNHALILMAGMKYEEALEFSKQMAEDFPEDPYVFNALGRAYMYMEMYDDAEKSLRSAIELYKGNGRFVAYKNLFRVYSMQARHKEAAELYLESMEKFELDDITTISEMGDYFDDAGRFEDALEYRRKAFVKKLERITGKEIDPDTEVNVCKAVKDYPEIAIEDFGDILFYLRKYAVTLSYMDRLDDLDAVGKDMTDYLEMAGIYNPVSEMSEH